MKAIQPAARIVPARGPALLQTFFFAVFLFMFASMLFVDGGSTKVNGQEVYGEERQRVHLMMSFVLVIPLSGLLLQARRLLPGSPFDFVEVGPQGLTVGTLFGRRHRPWEEITGFSVGNIPLTNPPIIWVKAESSRPLRFFMGGFVRFKLFSFTRTRIRAIAGWLDRVREAYVFGDGNLPPPPDELAGKIIPLTGDRASTQARSSVIERRS